MSTIRHLFAPLTLRFYDTDAILDALYMLERSYTNPKSSVSKTDLERGMIVLARELIRRKVVFWT